MCTVRMYVCIVYICMYVYVCMLHVCVHTYVRTYMLMLIKQVHTYIHIAFIILGLKEVGIFRLPGSTTRVNELKEAFTEGL